MPTGVAILVRGPGHDFPGAAAFVLVVLVLIVVIFIRVYGGNQHRGPTGHHSRRRTPRKSGRQAAHDARHRPDRGEHHGH
jgi:hypothetical protein